MNGTIESIWITSRAREPMVAVPVALAVPGVGLEGDRYAARLGHYSDDRRVSRDLTLVEAEVLEDLERAHGIELTPQEARRNVATRRIRLNDLVGSRFRVGAVLCEGTCLCEPCQYLVDLTGKAVLRPLAPRGGLRADILSAGEIRIGDMLTPE
jgi:MOSC domain-containing protein YiiM